MYSMSTNITFFWFNETSARLSKGMSLCWEILREDSDVIDCSCTSVNIISSTRSFHCMILDSDPIKGRPWSLSSRASSRMPITKDFEWRMSEDVRLHHY